MTKKIKTLSLALFIALFSNLTYAVEEEKKEQSLQEEITEYINHHVQDSHDFALFSTKDKVTEALESEDVTKRFKEAEKLILPFLYNLMKSDEPYIHWPNRTPIIKAQIEKFLEITRGKK